jgi:hypothetical protein
LRNLGIFDKILRKWFQLKQFRFGTLSLKTLVPLPSRHLENQALSQIACDVTRKAKRQDLFTFSESIKYGVLIILMED